MRISILYWLLVVFLPTAVAADEDAPPPQTRSALKARINTLLGKTPVAGATSSIHVIRLDTGATVYSKNGDKRLHPASNTKLVTTAAALSILGPAYRYKTDLVTDRFKNGTAATLYLIGRGDPRFVSESLWKLIDDARIAGLRRVRGDLVIDDTYFTQQYMAPGFDEKDQDGAYRAATGAASLNFNAIKIVATPSSKLGGKVNVRILPESDYITVEIKAKTVEGKKDRLSVRAHKFKDRTKVIVTGRLGINHGKVQVRRRIDNPPLFTGMVAKAFLERAGIKIGGKVRVARAPRKHTRLSRVVSRPLGMLIFDVNKVSNNFMAEHLLRTLGKVKRQTGDWEHGKPVVVEFLKKQVGLNEFTYVNGSGLFGKTAFSARQMTKILSYMHSQRFRLPEYAASLAIGGEDGTLWRRMKSIARGRVRAKTGTLSGVICLSGYVDFADGTPGAFSILMNGVSARPWDVWQVHDQIVTTLTQFKP